MKLFISIIILSLILVIIKNCEDSVKTESFISRVIESQPVKYLEKYKMGVDYYNNETGKLSNFLSNVLKFQVIGANPKTVVERVNNGKFHFGIIKENLLQDAFFGQGVFSEKHLNLRMVARLFPISLFFVSLRKSKNQIKSIQDIRGIKVRDSIKIGIYSPKYKFKNKLKNEEKDPSLLIYYKLFNHLGLKMGNKGKGTYQLEVYSKRDKLLEALQNKEIEFCGFQDVFTSSDTLKRWSEKIKPEDLHIFGLDTLPDSEIRFLFPRMKISNLQLSFTPYDKDQESNVDESLVTDDIVKLIVNYLFNENNYFWNRGQWKNLKNRDRLREELKKQWNTILSNQKKRNTILLQNQLLSEKDKVLKNLDISDKFININRQKLFIEKYSKNQEIEKLKKSVKETEEEQENIQEEIKELDKKIEKTKERMKENEKQRIILNDIKPKDINDTKQLKEKIKYIVIERNKLLNKKQEIIFNEEPLNFGKWQDFQRFPYWSPLTVGELKKMDNKKYKMFVDEYSETMDKEIEELELKKKKESDKKSIELKIKQLKQKKESFLKYKKVKPEKEKKDNKGYIDVTQYKRPGSRRSIAPVTFKTIQEYYVLISEEDVPIPPVYNVLYSFIKLPNSIKTKQDRILVKTNYNIPLHPAVKILYDEYSREENVENICKNKIGDMECIVRGLK